MIDAPIDPSTVDRLIEKNHLRNVGRASIRELTRLVDEIEQASGQRFIRMEMGIPGLSVSSVGTDAEISCLKSGVTSQYPKIQGLAPFKEAASRFIKMFLDIDIEPRCCLPTTGSTNASFLSFMVAGRRSQEKNTVLFLDPGFPVHKLQVQALGLHQESIDVYDCRGRTLRPALEAILKKGHISCLLYSNPNNPTWICFTEEELAIIGELCSLYDVVAMEDLAYFGMDFRKDYSKPGEPPFQPTVARYTENFMLLVSSSKVFSYAGHRIGLLAVSPTLFDSEHDDLLQYFTSSRFGHSLVFGAAYTVSAGVNYSSQVGLAAVMEAAADRRMPLLEPVRVYGRRAEAMKKVFTSNGFRIVYDTDVDRPIADGFYFTVAYGRLSGEELVRHLLYYGISAISLATTGSQLEGIRACVSLVRDSDLPVLEERLQQFHRDHRGDQG